MTEPDLLALRRRLLPIAFGFTLGVFAGPGRFPVFGTVLSVLMFAVGMSKLRARRPGLCALALMIGGLGLGLLSPRFGFEPALPVLATPVADAEVEAKVLEIPQRGLHADGLVVELQTVNGAPAQGRALLRMPHEDIDRHPAPCGRPGDEIRLKVQATDRPPLRMPAFRSLRPSVRRGVERYGRQVGPCTLRSSSVSRPSLDVPWLSGLVFSDPTGLSRSIERQMFAAGMVHLFYFSGLVLLAFCGLVYGLVNLTKRTWLAALLGLLALGMGGLALGPSPSLYRVSSIALCLLLPRLIGLKLDVLSALAISVMICLAISPAALGDVIYQLSFAGTSALLRFCPGVLERMRFLEKWPKVPRWAMAVAVASLSVALGMAPLVARLFDRITFGAMLVNLIELPIHLGVVGPLAILGVSFGAVSAPLLSLAQLAAQPILALVEGLVGGVSIPAPSVYECGLFYVAMGAAVYTPQPRERPRVVTPQGWAFVFSLALLMSIGTGLIARRGAGRLRVEVLPKTEGRAQLVRLPEGGVVVLDEGPPASWFQMEERIVSNRLKTHRFTKIDALLIRGEAGVQSALELEKQFFVDRVWWIGAKMPPALLEQTFDSRLSAPPRTFVHQGLSVATSSAGAVRFSLKKHSVLLSERCDLDEKADIIVASEARAECKGLQIIEGHTSSTAQTHWSNIYRTEVDGLVSVKSDGVALSVQSFLNAP